MLEGSLLSCDELLLHLETVYAPIRPQYLHSYILTSKLEMFLNILRD